MRPSARAPGAARRLVGDGNVTLTLCCAIRVFAAVAWAGLATACWAAADEPNAPAKTGVGRPLPDLGLSGERPALVWVFAARKCLGCELGEASRMVRKLQRRLGEGVEIVVVAVGEGGERERGLVSDFLASQRISAGLEMRTPKLYMRDFGSAPLPVFHVANRDGVIEAVVAADSAGAWRSAGGRRDLVGFVEQLANEGPRSSRDETGARSVLSSFAHHQ